MAVFADDDWHFLRRCGVVALCKRKIAVKIPHGFDVIVRGAESSAWFNELLTAKAVTSDGLRLDAIYKTRRDLS